MALFKKKCEYCKKVEKMLYEMRVKYKVIDVTKNPELITKYNFMTAPGIVIDGKLAFSGVPNQKIDAPPRLKSRGLKRCSIFGCKKFLPKEKFLHRSLSLQTNFLCSKC